MPQLSFLIRIRSVLRSRISLIFILDNTFIALSLSVRFQFICLLFRETQNTNQIMNRTQNSRCIVTNVLDKN